jgi:tRNA pseudouridine38-40 synthase
MPTGKSTRADHPAPLRNIRLVVEYDGTRYSGWQIQKGRPTVQAEIRRAVRRITGERATVIGASRTDAGVHATGQVANFRTSSRIPAERLVHALNFYLPQDIGVRQARDVSPTFHAQFDARWKSYRYLLHNSPTRRPLIRASALHVRPRLDLAAMRQAARVFVGRRDFRAFGSEVGRKKTTVRTIYRLDLRRVGECVIFEISGDGFLYTMVRSIVGTLIRAGQRRITPAEVRRILEQGDRSAAGPVVGPEGLCLVRVCYTPWKTRS